MVEIKVIYEGSFHCTAKHITSGMVIQTDAPKDNQGKGEAFSPTDLLAASLGVCTLTIMAMAANKKGIELKDSTVRVEKHMTKNLPRKVERIVLELEIHGVFKKEDRQELEIAARNCPVALSIHPDIKTEYTFKFKT